MRCPDCQYENKAGRKFCSQCGAKLGWKCPACGFDNDPEDRFCGGCGVEATRQVAPATEARPPQIPAYAGIAPPKLEEMHAHLQRFIPRSLAERMHTAGREMEGETRLVTALFADISGFTPASEQLSPEGLTDLVNECFKVIVDTICRYEGSVNRFIGDCVLAFFGAPIAHENDPERAIRAALEMREEVTKLGRSISVGINTGMMYIGPVGTDLHMEYTAEGYQINLARRLQESASAGQIVVGEATHKFTQRGFVFDELPPLSLRGISQSVQAYRVLRALERPEKLRGIEGLQAKLIGREREFAALIDAAEVLINEGRGQIATVVGEAGIGKSRLVRELRACLERRKMQDTRHETSDIRHETGEGRSEVSSLKSQVSSPESVLWLEGRCISIGQSVSFWPFIDMMRTYLGISGEDSEKQVADRLVQQMNDLFGQQAEGIIPYVGQMLSIKLPEQYQERIRYAAPEQIRHQTLLRMRDVFLALARRRPLILILEDMHWADDLSLDLLWVLMDELVAAPIMLVCIHRPERNHGSWQIDGVASSKHLERYTRISLRPLTLQQSQQMVESLLAVEDLPSETKSAILDKTEGNPFFVEEVIRWMMEQGVIFQEDGRWKAKATIRELAVPDTIQSVILARIDRLHEEVKYVLQRASVIGRVFQRRLLSYISSQGEALEEHLSELEDSELVYKEKIVPELEYAFKHALTQETTYQGLLLRQRSAFHERVGEGIETLYQEQIEEYYEQLAYHYSRSDNKGKAMEYLFKAGQKAVGRYANQEALVYFQSALDLAQSDDEHNRILKHRAELLSGLYRGKEAASDYERLLNNAKDSGDRKDEIESMLGLAAAYYSIGLNEPDFASKSLELYKQAYTLARELDDKACIVHALVPTVDFMDFWFEYEDEAISNAKEALALSQEIGDEGLIIDSMMAVFYGLAKIYENAWFKKSPSSMPKHEGDMRADGLIQTDVEDQAEELLKRIEARHDLLKLKEHYFSLIWLHFCRGNFERCIECCDAGIYLAADLGVLPVIYPSAKALALTQLGRYDAAWASLQEEIVGDEYRMGIAMKQMSTGMYFLELMAYEKASVIFEDVTEQAGSLNRPWLRSWAQAQFAKAIIRAGQFDQAQIDRITQELACMGAALPVELMGEIALCLGKLDEALQQTEIALSQAREIGLRPKCVSALELRSRVLLQLNKPKDVLAHADAGVRMAQEMSCVPMIWRLRASKAQALEMLGETDAATQEYEAAAAIIRQLADSIPDAEVKQIFMSNPLVSPIIRAADGRARKEME